jgi:signal transduction histidine kinase/CheY-like chemotaxis protein
MELKSPNRGLKSFAPLGSPSNTSSPALVEKNLFCSTPPILSLPEALDTNPSPSKKKSLPEIRSPPAQPRGHRRSGAATSLSRASFEQLGVSSPPTSLDSSECLLALSESFHGTVNGSGGLSLSGKQVRQLFPFHIAVDFDFQITQMGNSLLSFLRNKTFIKVPTPDHIGKYFRITSSSPQTNGERSLLNWDWYNSLRNVTKETVLELELSKDYLLTDVPFPIRFSGSLHRVHPKEDHEAVAFAGMFLVNPLYQSEEELSQWKSLFPEMWFSPQDLKIVELEKELKELKKANNNNKNSVTAPKLSSESTDSLNGGGSSATPQPQLDVRQLIGNVTHDLKTPLAGFLNGLECVQDYAQDLSSTVHSLRNQQSDGEESPLMDSMETKIQLMQHKIKDINDINNFMTMTINRCIDYAKLGQSVKLKPKLETVDLVDTLYLPLNCMKSLQTRIPIALEPIDDQKICPSVITDKQWLQENLLCLLSNAVKYSHEGEINVRMYLFSPDSLKEDEGSSSSKHSSLNKDSNRPDILPTERQRQLFLQPKHYSHRHSSFIGSMCRTNSSITAASPAGGGHSRMRTKSLTNDDLAASNSTKGASSTNSPAVGPTHRPHRSMDLSNFASVLTKNGSTPDLESCSILSSSKGITTSSTSSFLMSSTKSNSLSAATNSEYHSLSNKYSLSLDIPHYEMYEQSVNCRYLVFEIEDHGTGITEEARENLFNPFSQAQRLAGGTGLGLFSLAKRVEALYGLFGCEGRRDGGRGSLFWFAVPFRPDEDAAKLVSKSKFTDLIRDLNTASNNNNDHSDSQNAKSKGRNGATTPPARRYSVRQLSQQKLNISENMKLSVSGSRSMSLDKGDKDNHKAVINKTFSVDRANLSSKASPSTGANTSSAAAGTPTALHVLVVDDSFTITKTVRHALMRKGFTVDTAHNGLDALDKINARAALPESRLFDVILMDLNMPVLDGLEATRRLRQQEEEQLKKQLQTISSSPSQDGNLPTLFKHNLIVGMSADSEEETIYEALESGMDDFICKPFSMETFIGLLQKLELM